ncbi:hypothetical protein G7Y79_00079g100220 [Physcia stellaris]|nr:hypothetical protein G7Y79_00079g100220 [Physcia stellaris]
MYTSTLPDHCTPTTAFLTSFSTFFHTCIPTRLAFLSTLLGCLSILSWLFAQLPQIYKNFTLKSASGLSIFFLAEWLLGDITNLLGALFTKQATWQVVVAGYYVSVDLCLVFQYLWYSRLKPWRQRRLEDQRLETAERDDEDPRAVVIEVSPPEGPSTASEPAEGKGGTISSKPREARTNPFRMLNFSFSPKEKNTPPSPYRTGNPASGALGPSPKTILLISMLLAVLSNASPLHTVATPTTTSPSSLETAGRYLSWTSTILYLGSRLPQLYKNHVRRSTAGLSPILFIAAFFGNLFYSTSILTNPLAWKSYESYGLNGWAGPEGSDRVEWVSLAAPFWLGAAGVLVMDATMGVQFLQYGEEKKVVVIKDQRGRSRWRRVSGWMRGWVPSPSPRRDDIEEENEQPLLQREIGRDGGYGAA